MKNSDSQMITWVTQFVHHAMEKRNDNIVSKDQT